MVLTVSGAVVEVVVVTTVVVTVVVVAEEEEQLMVAVEVALALAPSGKHVLVVVVVVVVSELVVAVLMVGVLVEEGQLGGVSAFPVCSSVVAPLPVLSPGSLCWLAFSYEAASSEGSVRIISDGVSTRIC